MPYATTPAGRLYYHHNGVPGAPAAPVFVALHGAGGQGRDWPEAWRHRADPIGFLGLSQARFGGQPLARPFYALDLPGHGLSGGESCDHVSGYADAAIGFIEALALRRVILIGHSMGGGVVLDVAQRRHPALAGMVLIGTSAAMAVPDSVFDGLANAYTATVRKLSGYCWHPSAPVFYKAKGFERMHGAGQDTVLGDFKASATFDFREALGAIETPALVIAGLDDKMMPAKHAERTAVGLPNARYAGIAGAGHFPHVERPIEVGRHLEAFARTLDPQTASAA
ncbi:MAG: alpha/beta hydrolase [Pseudomonadota bacterium]